LQPQGRQHNGDVLLVFDRKCRNRTLNICGQRC
jgi:hypothetical protein